MNDEEKDFYIKGKIKDGYLPEKIDNLFNNSIKIIENKGEKIMEENSNLNINQEQNQNNQNNSNIPEKKKMPVALKRIIATAACLMILLGGGNLYATSQGYDNIFFLIKHIITGEDVRGKENILSDREIMISYNRIDISERLSIIIESLVVEENQAKLNLRSFNYLITDEDEAITLKYEIKDQNGKILCSQKGKNPAKNQMICEEELIMKDFSDNIKTMQLFIYNDENNEKIIELTIDLENKEVIIKDSMQKVSEVELKKYLTSFGYLVYPWEINTAQPKSYEVDRIIQAAIDLGMEKGILEYSKKGYSAEKIQEIVKAFIDESLTYNNIQENIKLINDTKINYDGEMYYRLNNNTPIYYQEIDGATKIAGCLAIDDISFSNGIYKVTFIHYSTRAGDPNIENLLKYKTTMSLRLNTDMSISKYSIVEIGETELVSELKNDNNNSENNSEKSEENLSNKYSIEKVITWTPNTTSYDFNTKQWRPNNTAEYYVATDKDKKLCIVDREKNLVKKFDIVITDLIISAYVAEWQNTLTIIQKDWTAYDINITNFTYWQYKYADGDM